MSVYIRGEIDRGKVMEKVRITNLFEPAKSIEIEAVIDTGATMAVLPQNIVDELGLRKVRTGGFRDIRPCSGSQDANTYS